MKPVQDFSNPISFLFTDIDDTLTDEGLIHPPAYTAIWSLAQAGIKVVPVTGRPAGWCELIARQWPVQGVIGENGAFYFRYHNKKMQRHFYIDEKTRQNNQARLERIKQEVLNTVPGCALASDQFCRLFDLAIDFCEDVPALKSTEVQKIVSIFNQHGAQAKISSIHVNGWFGDYNKLTMVKDYLHREWNISSDEAKKYAGFSGDSPNDEPMFEFFPHSFGVANIKDFIETLRFPPQYIAQERGGLGFVEISHQLINLQKK